jgi:DNA-binding XRE family transcriptional regulator
VNGLLVAHTRGMSSISETVRDRALVRSGRGRGIREGAGLTRSEVAKELGVDESTVWRWEGGHRLPRGVIATRYARLLRSLDRLEQ